MTAVLRRAILDSGLPLLRVARDTGVERASISRFVRGKNSLRLDVADKLAAYFGLTLVPTGKRPPKRTPEG
ncbi:MAG: helix-turn-helix domain-containing protein [Gemmataceae bacterium]|nr:helix-turn-helix domain-containing protein [Gemmataceae bacterium]